LADLTFNIILAAKLQKVNPVGGFYGFPPLKFIFVHIMAWIGRKSG